MTTTQKTTTSPIGRGTRAGWPAEGARDASSVRFTCPGCWHASRSRRRSPSGGQLDSHRRENARVWGRLSSRDIGRSPARAWDRVPKASRRAAPRSRTMSFATRQYIRSLWRTRRSRQGRCRCGSRDVRQEKPTLNSPEGKTTPTDRTLRSARALCRAWRRLRGRFRGAAVNSTRTSHRPAETTPHRAARDDRDLDASRSTLTRYQASQGVVTAGRDREDVGLPTEMSRHHEVPRSGSATLWPWTHGRSPPPRRGSRQPVKMC